MPDVGSLPVKATVSSWLYQPFASGDREAFPTTFEGAVSSYLNPKLAAVLGLSARSRQVPVTEASPRSRVLSVHCVQPSARGCTSRPHPAAARRFQRHSKGLCRRI